MPRSAVAAPIASASPGPWISMSSGFPVRATAARISRTDGVAIPAGPTPPDAQPWSRYPTTPPASARATRCSISDVRCAAMTDIAASPFAGSAAASMAASSPLAPWRPGGDQRPGETALDPG